MGPIPPCSPLPFAAIIDSSSLADSAFAGAPLANEPEAASKTEATESLELLLRTGRRLFLDFDCFNFAFESLGRSDSVLYVVVAISTTTRASPAADISERHYQTGRCSNCLNSKPPVTATSVSILPSWLIHCQIHLCHCFQCHRLSPFEPVAAPGSLAPEDTAQSHPSTKVTAIVIMDTG